MSADSLNSRLDSLLERYLELIDEYDQLRGELATHMSSGFLSLAQANFAPSSRNGRYGQDYYDGRMKAVRRVRFSSDAQQSIKIQRCKTREEARTERQAGAEVSTDEETQEEGNTPEDTEPPLPTPPQSRASSSVPTSDSVREHNDNDDDEAASLPTDPLRWFGVLVPPPLRATQARFSAAMDGPVPALVKAAMEMRQVEGEVGRLRKELKRAERDEES